jgi:hypothetical protein
MLDVSVDFIHRTATSRAVETPTPPQLKAYASAFASVFGRTLGLSKEEIGITIYLGESSLLVVTFHLEGARDGEIVIRQDEALRDVLATLDQRLWQKEGVNIYRRRHLRIFEDRAVHIVKPAELRFWTRSAGYLDADEVLAQTLAET